MNLAMADNAWILSAKCDLEFAEKMTSIAIVRKATRTLEGLSVEETVEFELDAAAD
jgi:hypothetical protein